MKVIVVDNPFVAMLLEMFLGGDDGNPIGKFLAEAGKIDRDALLAHKSGVAVVTANQAPNLKANPDFYTKPDVQKYMVLKVKSNTETGKMYDVTKDVSGNLYCTCQGFKYRGKCSHIQKVQTFLRSSLSGMGMCLNCQWLIRDEDVFRGRKGGCRNPYTIMSPPVGGCRHFKRVEAEAVGEPKKDVPMTFPSEGALLQTFQSRHFPEVQYQVKLKDGNMVCTCRGFQFHGNCKHVQYMKSRLNQGTIAL
jgi:hypothetical protein